MHCSRCGSALLRDARYCIGCGRRLGDHWSAVARWTLLGFGGVIFALLVILIALARFSPSALDGDNLAATEEFSRYAKEVVSQHIRSAETCQRRQDRECVKRNARFLVRTYVQLSQLDGVDRRTVIDFWQGAAKTGDLGYSPP